MSPSPNYPAADAAAPNDTPLQAMSDDERVISSRNEYNEDNDFTDEYDSGLSIEREPSEDEYNPGIESGFSSSSGYEDTPSNGEKDAASSDEEHSLSSVDLNDLKAFAPKTPTKKTVNAVDNPRKPNKSKGTSGNGKEPAADTESPTPSKRVVKAVTTPKKPRSKTGTDRLEELSVDTISSTLSASKFTAGPDPEQMSMYYFGGMDCRKIVDFTWSNLEKRLSELSDDTLLAKNDSGQPQDSPVTPRKQQRDPHRQMADNAVIAIACNNYALEKALPYQFRFSQEQGARVTELYMADKEWTEQEKHAWQMSPSLRRQHLCSLQGPWDWSRNQVLQLPYTRGASKTVHRLQDSYQLRLHKYKRTFALLLLRPGQTYVGTNGLLSSVHRCLLSADLVERLIVVYEGGGVHGGWRWEKATLEDWVNLRQQLVGGDQIGTEAKTDVDADDETDSSAQEASPSTRAKSAGGFSVPAGDRKMAKRGVPDSNMLRMACVNHRNERKEMHFTGIASEDIDWNDPKHIKKINAWRGQIYRRAGV